MLGGLAKSSAQRYAYAQSTFASFCKEWEVCTVPCSTSTLAKYVVWLKHQKNLGPDAIRGQVSAIRHLHSINGFNLGAVEDPRFKLVKKGVCKRVTGKDSRLPITHGILSTMGEKSAGWSDFDQTLFMATATLAYAGFFRISELCVGGKTEDFGGVRLQDLDLKGEILTIHLRSSKTDVFREGTKVAIKPWNTKPCPITALRDYLMVRPGTEQSSPLLVLRNGEALKDRKFREMLKRKCNEGGWEGNFNGHSLRIGAATDAARRGVPGHVIKILGRWRSDTFLRYIRLSGEDLAGFSSL